MALKKKKHSNDSNKNYYIAIACIVAIVLIVLFVNSQGSSNASADNAGQAYAGQAYIVAGSPASVEEIMEQQAKAGRMQKVYIDTPANNPNIQYAYLRNDN